MGELSFEDVTGLIEFDPRTSHWCQLSYRDHPNGCTNYNKYDRCPPKVCKVQDFIDLKGKIWFLINKFDLASHREWMRSRNPNWTDRQCNCLLYWQSKQRKQLREFSEEFTNALPGTTYDLCPEAKGVNIFKILRKHLKIPIVARPTETVYLVSMVGYKK